MKFGWAAVALHATVLAAFAQDPAPPTPMSTTAYTPMTSSERWSDYVSTSVFSPTAGLRVFGSAALSHFNREPSSYGMGARGYFERAGSHYARSIVQGGIHSSLAAALGHDTRYFREPDKTGWRRAGHALRRTLITRNSEGRSVFDVSNVASIYAGPLVSSTWHPHRYGPATQCMRGGDIGMGTQAVSNLLREFGPDVRRLFRK